MAQVNHLKPLTTEEQQSLDNVLERFGNVWKPGELERWLDWLPEPESALRVPMLLGMARIDMHNHWQQGQRPTVESYLQRFPELGEHDQGETLLIQSEYQARCQAGLRVEVAALSRRFNRSPEQLQQLLGLPSTVVEEDDPATRLIAKPQTQEDEQATRLIARSQVQAASRTLPAPQPVPSVRRRPRRRWLCGVVAGVLVLLALLAVAGTVVYLATDHGTVQIELNDPQAQVSIELDKTIVLKDGEKSIRLRAGEHGLVVSGKDHETVHKSFTVRRGKTTVVRVTLKKKANTKEVHHGTVRIQLSEPGAKANLRLERGLEIKDWKKPIRLPVGKHTLVVTGKEYETVRKTFTIRKGKTTQIELTLKNKGPVDLLARIDVQRDALLGQWGWQGKALLCPAQNAFLQVPYALPEEYDLTVIAQRLSNKDCLLFWLDIQKQRGRLVLDGWGGKISGLDWIDGKKADANDTTWKGQMFPVGKAIQVDVSVRKDRITVVAEGQTLIDWKPRPGQLRDRSDLPCTSCLVVGSYDTSFRISRLSLRPVSRAREPDTRKWTPDEIVARHVLFRGGTVEVTTRAGAHGCQQVGNLPSEPYRLRAVRLDRTDYSWDRHLAHLPVVESLEVLSADHANLGDAALAYLSQLKSLRELSVVGTPMSEKLFAELGKLTQLRLLRMGEGQFSEKALQQFQAKLPKCRVEKVSADRVAAEAVLGLNEAPRSYPAGVTYRTPDGKKRTVGSLRQLPRTPFRVTSLAMPQLVRVPGWRIKAIRNLPQLERLFFWANSLSSKDLLTMQNLPKLQDIQLGWNGIDEEAALHLSRFQQLRGLSLVATRCNDACLKHLKNLKQLRGIYLTRTPITDAGCQHLAEMTSLQSLELDQTRIGDAAIEHLAKMQWLRKLRVRRTRLTKEGLDRLRKALPRCKVVAK